MGDLTYATPNIMVVDDVSANLVILTDMIRNAGYEARPVTSARQAMHAIEVLSPHLILLDISMPDMDGFEFCSILKKNANTRDIPIIFISALNSKEDKIKGYKLGAVDYISKPFEIEEVTLRINTHLKIYKMQQELEIYNKKLYKTINDQIRKIYEEQKSMLYALAKLSLTRDGAQEKHLERIAKNSRILAMSLQLSSNFKEHITNSFIDSIELAAPLHDIGKIAIPDAILHKRTQLDPEEWSCMKAHSETGANMLKEIYKNNEHNEFIKMAIDIAWYHHENWDGTGFPKGLKGTQIPLSARIVAIVDVYDILVSERSYKQAYSHEESMRILNDASGKKFDPDIIDVFNKIQKQLKK
ncbi:response regulator [Mobilitalea sibirica]|uniref:Stage 0 sporulation protein A homolog n=1 Tax=Mobilitalea sibirica TaxID=1462919 RepID=A0A8J7H3M6_9FIRM|nr:HD domain-containing phosphohydrolase [Mobilitalea sibirica]MBH1941595.1 response regulator [Mobilitalea sibirica]